MFRQPTGADGKLALHDTQFEYAHAYLGRTRRMLFLRGPVVGAPYRNDLFGPTQIGDDILAMSTAEPLVPIYLFIDSAGGDVSTGLVLYDIIKTSRAQVITVGMNAASMATVLLAAGSKRLIFSHARLMLHLPQGQFQGDVEDVKIRTKLFSSMTEELVSCYIDSGATAGLVNKSDKEIRKQILKDINREFWLTAPEAIAYGLVDQIVTTTDLYTCDKLWEKAV